jgi:hypothetical protein
LVILAAAHAAWRHDKILRCVQNDILLIEKRTQLTSARPDHCDPEALFEPDQSRRQTRRELAEVSPDDARKSKWQRLLF